MTRACALLAACVLASAGVSASAPPAPRAPADTVVAYFRGTEWRMFDPVTRRDTLLLATGGRSFYWDMATTCVEYLEDGHLMRLDWEFGAQPWPGNPVPWIEDWWYNPDSLCWQGAARQPPMNVAPRPDFCSFELWQSSRDGREWSRIGVDTCRTCDVWVCDWVVPPPHVVRRAPALGLSPLLASMSVCDWGTTPAERATAPAGREPGTWVFVPCRSVPGAQIAFRIEERRKGPPWIRLPMYLVNRAQGVFRPLDAPQTYGAASIATGMAERAGYLLVSGTRTYVYDLRTGEQVFPGAGADPRSAVWIRRPAGPSVDTAGLRRLRERFR